jgi:small-conductance mechanosensitive channel
MPIDDLKSLLHILTDPNSLPGAAFYALLFALLAWLLGRAVRLAVKRLLDSHIPRADPTAVRFLGQFARLVIYILAILSYFYHIPVLRQLGGVWLTSVGLISVVVGIAAQSTLGNLISGVSLLLYRPFHLGDRLQIMAPSGLETGTVESLSLGYTTLQTDDARRIVIPNSVMASQISINLSSIPHHAPIILTLPLAPTADIDKARTLLTELAKSHPKVTEVTSCRITALSDTATTLTLTAQSPDSSTAQEIKSDLLESIRKRFTADNIPLSH